MDPLVQWLIQRRLEDGRLPRGPPRRSRRSAVIASRATAAGDHLAAQSAVSGIAVESRRSLRLHVDCFKVWEAEHSGSETQRD